MKLDLRKSLLILPNLFTCSSILCGLYATLVAASARSATEQASDNFYRAALLIVFAMFFDTVDGRVARITKTQSAFGVQLDSLADVVSFGVAPAVLVYERSLHELGVAGFLVSFAYLAAGAIRLARFNVLSMGNEGAPRQPSKYIVGLPIPGAAGILVSLVVAEHAAGGIVLGSPWIVLGVVSSLSFFMVSTIRFRSFKDLKLSWRTALLVSLAVATGTAIALSTHVSFALVWLLASYVGIGVLEALVRLSRRGRRHGPHAKSELLRRGAVEGELEAREDGGHRPIRG